MATVKPRPATTEPTSPVLGRQGWVVPLVFLVLFLTLTAVGIVVSTQKGAPKPDTYVAACKSQVESAVLDGVREITRTCIDNGDGTPTPATTEVSANDGKVGFRYPYGWSALIAVGDTAANFGNALWVAQLVPGPFFRCEGCDGPFVDVSISTGAKTNPDIALYPDFRKYIDNLYSDNVIYSNISIQSVTEGLGERYLVTGNINGLYTGTFETIYFTGPTQWASVNFTDVNPTDTASNEAWEIIKNSLDFSGIK